MTTNPTTAEQALETWCVCHPSGIVFAGGNDDTELNAIQRFIREHYTDNAMAKNSPMTLWKDAKEDGWYVQRFALQSEREKADGVVEVTEKDFQNALLREYAEAPSISLEMAIMEAFPNGLKIVKE